jgi:hypothetical protein
MQLRVRQKNAGDTISKVLARYSPQTIRFDRTSLRLWMDDSDQQRVRWVKQLQEQTLGITSCSSAYSFLYIENREVRHEILISLLTLGQSLPLKREQKDLLTVLEQDAIRPLIDKFFMSGNPIEVDGVRLAPTVERFDCYGVNFHDFAQFLNESRW